MALNLAHEPAATVALDPEDTPEGPPIGLAWLPESSEIDQVQMGQAMFRLQQWLTEMYRLKYARQDDEGVVCINEAVSARFALGLPPQVAFVVMPDLEAGWASLIPWDYAAMREGEPNLYLVTAAMMLDGEEMPDFGISFQIPDFAKANALCAREKLQLRRYMQTASGWAVDQTHFAEMPIVLLSSDHPIFNSGGTLKPRRGTKH